MGTPINMRSLFDVLDGEQQDNDRYCMRDYVAAAISGLLSCPEMIVQITHIGQHEGKMPHEAVAAAAWDIAEALYLEENKRFNQKE